MLQKTTASQAMTATDIHQQQVLDNLAKFAFDSNSMPSFSIASSGQASVGDSIEGGMQDLAFNPFGFVGAAFNIGGSRSTENFWSLTAVNDPTRLELMRCAYQRAVGADYNNESGFCPDCQKRFHEFYTGSAEEKGEYCFKEGDGRNGCDVDQLPTPDSNGNEPCICPDTEPLPTDLELKRRTPQAPNLNYGEDSGAVTINCVNPGRCRWFGVGPKEAIPKDCPCQYVGHHCGTYVWVLPGEGRDELAKLTLVIMDFALNSAPTASTKEVTLYRKVDATGIEQPSTCEDATKVVKMTIPAGELAETRLAYPGNWSRLWPMPDKSSVDNLKSELEDINLQMKNIESGIEEIKRQKSDGTKGLLPSPETRIKAMEEELRILSDAKNRIKGSIKRFEQSPQTTVTVSPSAPPAPTAPAPAPFLQGDGLTQQRILVDRFLPPGGTR